MQKKLKLVRITTVPLSLDKLLEGQLKYMSEFFNVTAISSDQAYLEKVSSRENADFFSVPLTRTITPIQDMIALWKLFWFFRRLKPDIVHTHTPKAGTVGILAAWLARVPLRFHTVAGLPLLEAKGIKRSLLNVVERCTYLFATKIYPNSEGLKSIIVEERFCPEEKLKVIGSGSSNGINTEYFNNTYEIISKAEEISSNYKVPKDLFTFIFIGRLVKDKGIEELIAAFSSLVRDYPSLALILVGPQESELDPLSTECLEEIKNNRSIFAVGYQSDVRPWLCLAKALVFPSYREGFPNVPMQAGCFNLPSIVTNINGCNEIVFDRENGLIVPVKDVESLRVAMETLYLNKDMYRTMVDKSRKMITDKYEQKVVWKLILEEYKLYLKKGNCTRTL